MNEQDIKKIVEDLVMEMVGEKNHSSDQINYYPPKPEEVYIKDITAIDINQRSYLKGVYR